MDALGNALGNSIAEYDWGETTSSSMTARESFRRDEINAMNDDARVANALDISGPGMSEEDYWNRPSRTTADRYADAYGGEVISTGDRLRLSSSSANEPLPAITDPRIAKLDCLPMNTTP